MELNLDEITNLLDAFEERNMQTLRLKKGDFELLLERQPKSLAVAPASPLSQQIVSPQPVHHAMPPHFPGHEKMASDPKAEADNTGKFITSPMVGTFYSAAAPGEPNFVNVGDTVKEGDVVCIIEAMKVMNEVKATESGVVKEILIENGHPVEFGTKLYKIS